MMDDSNQRLSTDNRKLISTTSGWRVSQACDRCRMKKIRCDGGTPCSKCLLIGFECTTSDKLSRRAFPKGYTANLEKRIQELEDENHMLKTLLGKDGSNGDAVVHHQTGHIPKLEEEHPKGQSHGIATMTTNNNTIHINNPIDQIFNLDRKGAIIGNDNLNFESQFNHLLINLNLPFLKITNSHNYLLNDPDLYLYHPSYSNYNDFHNKDLEIIYNPLSMHGHNQHLGQPINSLLPGDIYDLFIKLINNFKKLFNSKKELDHQIVQFFLNYNTFIPIFDYKKFMESYDAFHTMYPFMFTYDDATINGFNISTNDYEMVNNYLMVVIQIYAMIMMNDPSLNMNLLLNHSHPNYSHKFRKDRLANESILKSLYDFLPYLNPFHVSMSQLQTYLLFFYYSLLTNNKEKSLVLSAMINSFIGILGINLNSKNLFFNDLSLNLQQRRDRVKIFWGFKVLLKCFNLKFGFKPSINTTVINPVTIERYFRLTPEKLSTLLEPSAGSEVDSLFQTLLKPSIEFLNLMNIIIPSSFSPNYYQYLKSDKHAGSDTSTPQGQAAHHKKQHPNNLDWILNDDGGDGNDGNLNYNFAQFLAIDKNLSNWRYSLKDRHIDLMPLHMQMGLPILSSVGDSTLYHRVTFEEENLPRNGLSEEGVLNFANTGIPDMQTAAQLIKMQLNFHYLLIRSMNYLNFVIDRELTQNYYVKIANISREVLAYFILIFEHVGRSVEQTNGELVQNFNSGLFGDTKKMAADALSSEIGLDVDDDGFVINDFSVKRRKVTGNSSNAVKRRVKEIPFSPFNSMLNGLSLTIINLKKSIVLQMLYLLICTLKIAKKGGSMSRDTVLVLNKSISLFILIFINYQPNANKFMKTKKVKEDDLFKRIINDELKDDFLKDKAGEDSEDEDGDVEIDWDDEDMDEDLKYLKTLKYIKYKTNILYEKSQSKRVIKQESESKLSKTPSLPPLDNNRKVELNHPTVQLPPLIPPSGYVSQASPPAFPLMSPTILPRGSVGGVSKVPSLNKYEFFLGGEKDEDTNKERIAADLMNMKHGGRGVYGNWQFGQDGSTGAQGTE